MAITKDSNKIVKGASRQFTFRKLNATGSPEDVTAYSGIIVGLVNRRTTPVSVIEQWSLNTLSGYSDNIVIRDQATEKGYFDVNLDADKTQDVPAGHVYFEIKLQEDDAQFANGKKLKSFVIYKADNGKEWEMVDSIYEDVAILE